MSTLKVTHLQNESNSAPSISISSAVGGGVTFAGISTFHGAVKLEDGLDGGSTNTITASTNGSERLRITSGGNVNIGGNFTETSHQLNISDSTKPSLCLHTGTTQRADFSATSGITSIRSFSNSPFTINIGGSGETEAFRIDGNGDIGINKSSITSWGANIPTIEIKGRAETGSQAVRSGAIAFESGSGTNGYAILWGNEGGIEYYSSATNRATAAYGCKFTSSGNLAFASGKGIDFSATGDGSGTVGTNGELLDEYEEGFFTPTIVNGFSSANMQYKAGRYTRIGNSVYCDVYIRFDTGATANGGDIQIGGLPFNISSLTYGTPGTTGQLTRGGGGTTFQNLNSGDGNITFYGAASQSYFTCYIGGTAWATVTSSGGANGAYIIGIFQFHAD